MRAFFSFEFDEDEKLKIAMAGQSELSTLRFAAADWSAKEAGQQKSREAEAESRICRSDVVAELVGPKTHQAPGLLKEVAIARRPDWSIVQIIGHEDTSPTAVPNEGPLLRCM